MPNTQVIDNADLKGTNSETRTSKIKTNLVQNLY